jgi:hypothetical protein
LGIGNLTLLEKKTGMWGHTQACGFLVLALVFFLVMSCFTPNKQKFISMILLVPVKGLVLQTNNNYSFSQDASSTIN